jgi:hypothetical protein
MFWTTLTLSTLHAIAMPTLDPRIDAYIAAAPAFAQPILTYLRESIHEACPDVVETMKWSRPHFEHNGLLCGMAAFKAHCAFGFWKGALMFSHAEAQDGMNHFGKIATLADLPPKEELMAHVRTAVKLNAEGAAPVRARAVKPPLEVPDFFKAALAANAAGEKTFNAGSTSFKREYVEWITEAKTEATRDKRMAQAVEWLAEGKARNWKYQNC